MVLIRFLFFTIIFTRSPEFEENNAFTQPTVLNERAQLSSQRCCVSFFLFSFPILIQLPSSFLTSAVPSLNPSRGPQLFSLRETNCQMGAVVLSTLSLPSANSSFLLPVLSSFPSFLEPSRVLVCPWILQLTWLCVGSPPRPAPALPRLISGQPRLQQNS